MKKLSLILASVLVFGISMTVSAQGNSGNNGNNGNSSANHDITVEIPSYSLVGISSTAAITLEPGAPTEAGDGLDFSASSTIDNSIWLNYSSILSGTEANSISVEMVGDELPTGVTIELEAAEDAGNGDGEVGGSAGVITLDADGHDVITGIGNCYTGKGGNSGHQLTYTLKMSDSEGTYAALVSGTYDMTITYTITEN